MYGAVDFFDIPFLNAIEYFGGMIANAMKWATLYGQIFGLVGIVWTSFQVIVSKLAIKDFLWKSLANWVCFLLLMSSYGFIINFFSQIGNEVGIKAGGGTKIIEDNLSAMYDGIQADKQRALQKSQTTTAFNVVSEYIGYFENAGIDIYKSFNDGYEKGTDYNTILDNLTNEVNRQGADSYAWGGGNKKTALEFIKEAREEAKKNNQEASSLQTDWIIQAIDEVTTRVYPDGKEGEDITKSYLTLNLWLNDKQGNRLIYLSPASMFRLGLLCCNIKTWKLNNDYDVKQKEIGDGFTKIGENLLLLFQKLCDTALNAVGNLVLIVATVFCMIQYIMTILEYTIISGLGAIFIPLVLFDGTKDIPKKLIPVFVNMMIKFIVMTSCLIFVYWLFINDTSRIMGEGLGGAWTSLATTILNCVLAYVLTSNAPKIAQTILTGQPQMSMGEFVAGAGALVGTAVGAGKVAKAGSSVARGAVNTGKNIAGTVSKIQGAKEAKDTLTNGKGEGGKLTAGQKFANTMSATGAVLGDSLKNSVKEKGSNWLHGGGKGGNGGGGSSENKYNQTGTNKDGSALSNNSNNNYKNAKMTDGNGQSRSMTTKEFNAEKKQQGANLMLDKMAQKEAKQNAKADSGKLPDSLTGNKRQTEANKPREKKPNSSSGGNQAPKLNQQKKNKPHTNNKGRKRNNRPRGKNKKKK